MVVLETRLRTSKEEQQRMRQTMETMEDTSSEYQRIQREVASLRSKLMEYKVIKLIHTGCMPRGGGLPMPVHAGLRKEGFRSQNQLNLEHCANLG